MYNIDYNSIGVLADVSQQSNYLDNVMFSRQARGGPQSTASQRPKTRTVVRSELAKGSLVLT